MSHKTETGEWPSRIEANNNSSISVLLKKITNEPLPWISVAFIVAIFCVFEATKAIDHADSAKQAAFDAQTQSLLLRDYVDRLRIEMASHGIKPPDYPEELRHVYRHSSSP